MKKNELIEIIIGCVINSQVLTGERVCFDELRKELNEEIPEQLLIQRVVNCNHDFQRVERGGEFEGNQCHCGEWENLT
jgi:hypothetical protein